MSVAHFGRITPLQGDVLAIGGVLCGIPADLQTQEAIIARMRRARNRLGNLTGKDFGYDLCAWHEYLLSDEKLKHEYTFRYAWSIVRIKVQELIENDTERLELITLAMQG